MSDQAATAWPPPNMHGFTAPKSKPAPGVNPRYDELEDHRRRYAALEKEAINTLANHDARREGLAANRDFYCNAKEQIAQQQLKLLSA
jgi:hypothetical protein